MAGLLADDKARERMRRQAYDYSRGAVWQEVGRRYLDLLEAVSPRGCADHSDSQRELGVSVA